MKVLGFYDLHNDFSINIDTELSEADTTMFHEMTHMSVTLQSRYGSFLRQHRIYTISGCDDMKNPSAKAQRDGIVFNYLSQGALNQTVRDFCQPDKDSPMRT